MNPGFGFWLFGKESFCGCKKHHSLLASWSAEPAAIFSLFSGLLILDAPYRIYRGFFEEAFREFMLVVIMLGFSALLMTISHRLEAKAALKHHDHKQKTPST
jgi:hypothetical protein